MRQPNAAAPPTGDTWERDWRGEVMRQLREMDEARQAAAAQQAAQQQSNAVILERHLARLDEHDRRIAALESAPVQQAQQQQTRVGLNLQALYTGVAICALLVAILSPHLALTFH